MIFLEAKEVATMSWICVADGNGTCATASNAREHSILRFIESSPNVLTVSRSSRTVL